ncbi:hypothetical protein QUB56_00110 [Microcoleus sp. AR_TQ3_B6]|uniref:hypothetical protein n=1 Tax=Microcoleus sp. AR_TQ3_B6 TaxID=3055284 RepID=UPI002FD4C6E0
MPIKNMMKRCKPVASETGRFLPNGQAAKRGLNRSIADACWYALTQKLEYVAAKSGKKLYRVDREFQRWYPPRDLSVESIPNRFSKILKKEHLSRASQSKI